MGTTNFVDLHILRTHSPQDWYDRAVASCEGEPVNLHLLEGIPGKVGLARAAAFRRGTAPYVAWVDDDDELVPGAIEQALAVLEARPEVVSVYSDLEIRGEDWGLIEERRKPLWTPMEQCQKLVAVHHLHVVRRRAVMRWLLELERWDFNEEWSLMAMVLRRGPGKTPWIHWRIPQILYRARRHDRYHRSGQGITHQLRRAALREYDPILMDLHRRGVHQHQDQI